MAFDQNEFVRLLTDYYEFRSRTFWDVTVQCAPAGGWPSINHGTLAHLQMNDQAVALLCQLPYPDFDASQVAFTPRPSAGTDTLSLLILKTATFTGVG